MALLTRLRGWPIVYPHSKVRWYANNWDKGQTQENNLVGHKIIIRRIIKKTLQYLIFVVKFFDLLSYVNMEIIN